MDSEKEAKAIYSQLDVYKGQLNTKSEIADLHKVAKLFNEYAKRRELEELYEKVNPVLKAAEEVTLTAKNDISQLRNIVSRFDEVVNDKASKFNLHNVEEQIKKFALKTEMQKLIYELSQNFIPIQEKMEDVEAKMDVYKK